MNTPFNTSHSGMQEQFDTGPLSWVIVEIREALNRSKAALHEALAQDAEVRSTALRHAKTHLHQAHGALQIVDVDGVAIITETVEDLFDRADAGQVALTVDMAQAIEHAYQALLEYLGELLSGMPHQPVRLFPYYRALLEARGAERIHPADLFFPNLANRPQLPPVQPLAQPVEYLALRKRFERALLPFLKSTDSAAEAANAAAMRDLIDEVERAQDNPQSRGFWWVLNGFAEAVAAGQIGNELYVKQLFARINLQLRRLSEGSPSIAERLLRDALFFIARIEHPTPHGRQIRLAYQLDGAVPADYEKKRYGQIDGDALGLAKEHLARAKNAWSRMAEGHAGMDSGEAFTTEWSQLIDAGARLKVQPLWTLLRELGDIARQVADGAVDRAGGERLRLEMAASLLFVDDALNHIGNLPENFAERANALAARLLTVLSGREPFEAAPWLDDMSRQAQQRQTMQVLAGELQSSLRQVEKMLEEYFGDPGQRGSLGQIEATLHQIGGALAVLDQDDALQAVLHTQDAVRGFAEALPDAPIDTAQFEQVARNVGALGFFVETLQLHGEAAKKRFSFDADAGIFHANLHKHNANEGVDVDLTAGRFSSPTVEDDLLQHQQQSESLARSLTADPDNPLLQEQLKASLEQVRRDARLIDNPEANDRAQAAIQMLDDLSGAPSQQALAEIVAAATPPQSAAAVSALQQVQAAQPAPDTDEAIDAELLEIFLGEAVEVLACVTQTLPASRSEPNNQVHMTTLRRSFHTLKGSGRMVGLTAFGEAAWSIEQVLNMRLAEARAGDADLYALLDRANELLRAWVDDLQHQGKSSRTPQALVQAAERVKDGAPFVFESQAEPGVDAVTGAGADPDTDTLRHVEEQEFAAHDAVQASTALEQEPENALDFALALPDEVVPPATGAALGDAEEEFPVIQISEVLDYPEIPAPHTLHDDSVKRIGSLEISVTLHNIYLAETDELVRLLSQDIAEWRHEPDRQVHVQALHAAHSLAGSSATVGVKPVQEIAHALEKVLQCLARNPVRLADDEYDVLEHGVERVRFMLQMFALGEMPNSEGDEVARLERLKLDLDTRLQVTPHWETALAAFDGPHAQRSHADADSEQALDFAQSADDLALPADDPRDQSQESPLEHAEPAQAVFAPGAGSVVDPAMLLLLKDELDPDLLPVFLEEGRDMLPHMGQQLRAWQYSPADAAAPQSVLRLLHTLKGSARMAGAMNLGQHLHEMETQIEQWMRSGVPDGAALDELMARHDHSVQLFEDLQRPTGAAAPNYAPGPDAQEWTPAEFLPSDAMTRPTAAPDASDASAMATEPAPSGLPPAHVAMQAKTTEAARAAPLVRVRADILDRMVNQAGEVSIARSRLETEVGTLKQSLADMTENVARLRDQLREIEMQAETQMSSRMAHSADREFDPLEFDRFTRLQELTRMMAESVEDVGSVQQNLARTVENASAGLHAQARLTRDLQQDLMRVRMVQFASIAERLYRVTRQTSKEVDKRVNLDIRGSAVEIDRSVLEKMTGPFEHLLRNAIVHGIEQREQRHAAGKKEIGELLVEIRQEGNEVVIQFSDDGKGLNLEGIRGKARALGLLNEDDEVSDAEATDLIFHPGFSTAEQVTELAGRGVGMDVVRSEAAALGGRVAVFSEAGKGAHFTIHLPLTLAVTQVVVLNAGGKTYAVPSVLVEQVQQLKADALAAAYHEGSVAWQGQSVPLYFLSTLLADKDAAPVTQHYSPMMIVRSGNDRVAIHVDQIVGNREVVVKNIGPQLARMVGIAGATVLGAGDIVLILNPVPLALRAAHDSLRAPRVSPSEGSMDATADGDARGLRGAYPGQGLRGYRSGHRIVMVVDDSLTVRRVTQRLLAREGYQVVLAKDGVDALEQLQSITPDVMLVDIEMPRMDGYDLTRNIRGDTRTHHLPIIMITSRTAAKHRNHALELGVNAYFGKPYQEDVLLATIAGFVDNEA